VAREVGNLPRLAVSVDQIEALRARKGGKANRLMITPTNGDPPLQYNHRDFLHRCAISDEIIDGRPYYSLDIDSRTALQERWGLSNEAVRGDGIVIPRHSPDGTETYPQIRYTPPKDDQKYTCPVGSGGVVDVHPSATARAQDVDEPIVFVESIKGADALLSNGLLAAGFHGVYGWKHNKGPSFELKKIPLAGRDVGILFDADATRRDDLRRAIEELSTILGFSGARVCIMELPDSVGEKAGVDDYLAVLGSLAGAVR